jgi:magnesium chelatase subunit D
MIGDAIFPFSALVAQESMKRALILAAIHPGLGGVLIRGSKGSAKSTAVRALAVLLPPISIYDGDPFRRAPGEEVPGWPLAENSKLIERPVALVNLPVGATDDRVVGSLNLERALATGTRSFEPGLLASAHRGILYIDEVNLLGDHLVDLLLDAAAMGVNHVEREGLAFQHPARFVLVGTMNPEEGDLRPQLLDRFGLAVEVEPMSDPRARSEVVRRRLAFEADPAGFRARWAEADNREGTRIAEARRRLPDVVMPEPVLEAVCTRCAQEGADGLRADLTIYKAASALAAYEGRTAVTPADVDTVAELALAHRRTGPPAPPTQGPPPSNSGDNHAQTESSNSRKPPTRETRSSSCVELPRSEQIAQHSREDQDGLGSEMRPGEASGERAERGENPARSSSSSESPGPSQIGASEVGTQLLQPAAEPGSVGSWSPKLARSPRSGMAGRRGRCRISDRRGAFVRSAEPAGPVFDLAFDATVRAAALWQVARGRTADRPLIVRPSDMRVKVRARPVQNLILFVVDASQSMGARERMRLTKAAVLSLLVDAYQKRDRVGLITFRGQGAQLALPPTRSVLVAATRLSELSIGGITPLAAGMEMASQVVAASRLREPGLVSLVVLVTDGRANRPLRTGADPQAEALALASQFARAGLAGLVIDTEGGFLRLSLASALAQTWGVECKELDTLKGKRLPEAVRRALFARIAS